MLKKILTGIYIFLFILAIYILQVALIDGRTLFGIKPNLILISVVVVSLWYGIYIGSIYGFLIGFVTDIIFGGTGMFTIAYTIIGMVIGYINGSYRKESKMSLVYVTIIATSIFELLLYFQNLIVTGVYQNIVYLIKQITLGSLLNVVIVYIVYSVIYNIVEYFDDRLKASKSF